MQIALIGGTGDIGEGLALRLAMDTDHSIIIGSRTPSKAAEKADEYNAILNEHSIEPDISSCGNQLAAEEASIVILAVPPQYVLTTVDSISSELDSDNILVSPGVSMSRDSGGFQYDKPEEGSVAEAIVAKAPDDVSVVGSFQNLAANSLANLNNDLSADVVVTGDDHESKETIKSLVDELVGLRPLDGGPLMNSSTVESATPLLINVAMHNADMHDLSIQFR